MGVYRALGAALSCDSEESLIISLCQARADLNLCDTTTYLSPMMIAAQTGRLASLKYMHSLGGDLHKPAMDQCTCLILAAKNGHLDVVKYLCESRADHEHTNADGVTALVTAGCRHHTKVYQYLKFLSPRSKTPAPSFATSPQANPEPGKSLGLLPSQGKAEPGKSFGLPELGKSLGRPGSGNLENLRPPPQAKAWAAPAMSQAARSDPFATSQADATRSSEVSSADGAVGSGPSGSYLPPLMQCEECGRRTEMGRMGKEKYEGHYFCNCCWVRWEVVPVSDVEGS
mmetsp:Transcript_90658/g.184744  ORF Transcript_90658/g.184744 Transcript_90658/m.184744 type:complete len:286 (+) Transcript_90658:2-859(+)